MREELDDSNRCCLSISLVCHGNSVMLDVAGGIGAVVVNVVSTFIAFTALPCFASNRVLSSAVFNVTVVSCWIMCGAIDGRGAGLAFLATQAFGVGPVRSQASITPARSMVVLWSWEWNVKFSLIGASLKHWHQVCY